MEKIKVLKPGSVIKGIDVSDVFYGKLLDLALHVSNPDELVKIKEEESEEFPKIIEPLLVLLQNLQELAEQQDLVTEIDVENPND